MKINVIIKKLVPIFVVIGLSILFFGCGNSSDSNVWVDDNSIVRVSNLKGRVIAQVYEPTSNRASISRAYFSLTSTAGTNVFIEDNPSLCAVADNDGFFVIPNVPEGKHRVVASVVAGTTAYRQRSDVVTVTGQYETQEMAKSIELVPALYNIKMYINDLTNGSPVVGKVNIWGFSYEPINGLVNLGPFPAGTSKEATITAIGYKDLKALINFGEDYNSEMFIKMTPSTSTDSNQAPIIEIQDNETIVKTNQEITLSGLGMDPEGDVITWKWTASSGEFYNANSQTTIYRTPSASGTVRITLSGSDSKGAVGQAVLDLRIEQGGGGSINPQNQPPNAPSSPYPANLATGMGGELTLAWSCSDPNNDALTYTVNFGKQGSQMQIIVSGLATPAILIKDLEANTKYNWQVTAYDEHYASTNSDIWQFTTGSLNNQPPYLPTYPTPEDLAVNIDEQHVAFSWSGGDPDGDPVTYSIYLATDSSSIASSTDFALIQTTNLLKFDYYGLAKKTTYKWYVVATDGPGAVTEGPIWQFSTVIPENKIPSAATITEPANGATNIALDQKLRWTATDEDGDTLYYDVYFGTASEPPLVSASQPSQIYNPGTLENGKTYYWRIVVSDGKDTNSESGVWSFTTEEILDPVPYLVSITAPASSAASLRLEFSEHINNSKESEAFKFSPAVSGTWTWSNDNTVAEFTPNGGWLPGSYNKFTMLENKLEDSTGKLVATSTVLKFDIPSSVPIPAGYHSYAFPMTIAANQTVNISIPDLAYGKKSYVIAISDEDVVKNNARASLKSGFSSNSKDPTHKFRVLEANLINTPIGVPSNNTTLKSVASVKAIGDERFFYIDTVATQTTYPNNRLSTKLTKMSGNTLVYVDSTINDSDSVKEVVAQKVLSTFDSVILSKVRNAFGSEPDLGVDGESRISIVLVNMDGFDTAGYYTPVDLFANNPSNSTFRESNEGKIIYIDYSINSFPTTLFGTLAHEFQHMINFYQKNKSLSLSSELYYEDTWLNEALSKYSEEICGFSLLDGDESTTILVKDSMQQNNNLSVTAWLTSPYDYYCYGQVYLFMHFLAYPGRYNGDSAAITRALVKGGDGNVPLIGEANVENVTGEPFKETMAKWALSLCLNDYNSTNPKAYAIHGIDLTGSYNGVKLPGYTIENADNPISLSTMRFKDSVRFFRKSSTESGNTTISLTAGTVPVTLWLFDERE